jgi:hypothetical protein
MGLKYLFLNDFVHDPEILWITLLISAIRMSRSLKNQGLCWIAQKKSKV